MWSRSAAGRSGRPGSADAGRRDRFDDLARPHGPRGVGARRRGRRSRAAQTMPRRRMVRVCDTSSSAALWPSEEKTRPAPWRRFRTSGMMWPVIQSECPPSKVVAARTSAPHPRGFTGPPGAGCTAGAEPPHGMSLAIPGTVPSNHALFLVVRVAGRPTNNGARQRVSEAQSSGTATSTRRRWCHQKVADRDADTSRAKTSCRAVRQPSPSENLRNLWD